VGKACGNYEKAQYRSETSKKKQAEYSKTLKSGHVNMNASKSSLTKKQRKSKKNEKEETTHRQSREKLKKA